MLTQLRIRLRRLTTPSFIKALKSFSLSKVRNPQNDACRTGYITWLDLTRNPVIINGQYADFLQAITAYKTKNNLPKDNEYRKVLHGILNSKFQETLNINVSGPLIDECVTMLNQASLYGASAELVCSLGKDIHNRIHPDIEATVNTIETEIKTISESDLRIQHTQRLSLKSLDTGRVVSSINTVIHFDINADASGTVTYSNPKISFEIPKNIASNVLSTSSIRMANMFAFLNNIINRARSRLIGGTFSPVTPYELTHTSNLCIIGYKLPHYTCSPVALPEIEDKKEKRQQKQQSLYQTRSTFTPPKHSNSSNKDSNQRNKPVPVKVHNPEIQPQKEPKTQSRPLQ
ncbi:hypothetical protein [Ehrlichia japonica]|uniref:Uncharacterized protein n=1 Tax=Ehrlichia japonica TaxID=391036 RepID=X5H2J8_9RICK|nr:hypothetical protein [Ehrlichia japonica]AHX04325.1 hypothetical protein EHF_0755 [Ehrlichia japonica]